MKFFDKHNARISEYIDRGLDTRQSSIDNYWPNRVQIDKNAVLLDALMKRGDYEKAGATLWELLE